MRDRDPKLAAEARNAGLGEQAKNLLSQLTRASGVAAVAAGLVAQLALEVCQGRHASERLLDAIRDDGVDEDDEGETVANLVAAIERVQRSHGACAEVLSW